MEVNHCNPPQETENSIKLLLSLEIRRIVQDITDPAVMMELEQKETILQS